jgi:hypothetical protein
LKLALHARVRRVRRQPTNTTLLVYCERALELNPSAEEIVALLDGSHGQAEIVALIGARHPEAEPERVRDGVACLLAELEARGLLEQRP